MVSRRARLAVIALAACAVAGCSGADDPPTAPAAAASPGEPVVITDARDDVATGAVDLLGGTLQRRDGTLVVTFRLREAAPTGGPAVSYAAIIENERDGFIASAQTAAGGLRFQVVPQDGSPPSDVRGRDDGRTVTVTVPLDLVDGDGPLRVSLLAQDDAGEPAKDMAPDDGWPGPGRVDVP